MSLRFAGTKYIYAMFGLYDNVRNALSKILRSEGCTADFDKICSRLVEEKVRRKRMDDFYKICSSFKTGGRHLDNMVYECVGMSGDDLLVSFRSRKPQITM